MMRNTATLLALATTLFAGSAFAVTAQRVRGTIASVTPTMITVNETDGSTASIALNAGTHYAAVVKSSLDDLKKGDFIGTATKGPANFMVALEVVIFPNSMRGTGEGHYAWDDITDTTAGGTTTPSSMTNGSVTAEHAVPAKTGSSMTNGTVSASGGDQGTRTITVSYGTGSAHVIVPPTAPIVAFRPADKSVVTNGGKAFVVVSGDPSHLVAKFVAIGQDGVTPPM